jgi:flavorubredoxin
LPRNVPGGLREDRMIATLRRMPRLLIVHHTPSPATAELLAAVRDGAAADGITDVEVVVRPALAATAMDALEADGYLVGTPANIGYMSGAVKHWFDQVYYPCQEATAGRPYGAFVHGANDTTGAVRAIESIATGMGWTRLRPAIEITGIPAAADLHACWELGATMAAALMTP